MGRSDNTIEGHEDRWQRARLTEKKKVPTAAEMVDQMVVWMPEMDDLQHSHHTREEKIRACVAYVVFGTYKRAGEHCGIKPGTLRCWGQSDWWAEVQNRVHAEHEDFYRAGLHEILRESMCAITDRIRDGDKVPIRVWEKDEDGKSTQVVKLTPMPVKARDLAYIFGVSYDKLRLSNNLPTSIGATGGNAKKLEDLADQFVAIASQLNAKTIEGKATVVEKDAKETEGKQ